MKSFLFVLLAALTLGMLSCKHHSDPIDPQSGQGTVAPIGTALGAGVQKQIGPEGGSLQSADGTFSLTIPAGALSSLTTVGIQAITNTCPGGIGSGWRLTPHGIRFAKPVELAVNYTALKDSVTLPNAYGMAFQDSTGIWRFVGATSVNPTTHVLKMQTNHFSDWTSLQWLSLWPITDQLKAGESITLEARTYVPIPEDLVFPLVPDYENGYPVGKPEWLDPKYIKTWSLAGAGTLTPIATRAVYKAPASIKNTQTVTVNLELQNVHGQDNSKIWLVSNLTLIGKQPTITYLQMDEYTVKQSRLIIYGANFGAQDAQSKVTINGAPVEEIELWGDNIIVCYIPLIGPNSSGNVQVSTGTAAISQPHILNEWNVTMEMYRPCAHIGQSLHHKGTIHLRIRGDATTPPANLNIIGQDTEYTTNVLSYVSWEAGGEGISQLNNEEACGTEKEKWTQTEGKLLLNPKGQITDDQYFKTSLWLLPGEGFDVSLDYHAINAVPSHFVFTDCRGHSSGTDRPFSVHFPSEFHEEKFPLRFNGTKLKAGTSRIHKTGIGSMNLHTNGSDANWQPDIKVTWSETPARY